MKYFNKILLILFFFTNYFNTYADLKDEIIINKPIEILKPIITPPVSVNTSKPEIKVTSKPIQQNVSSPNSPKNTNSKTSDKNFANISHDTTLPVSWKADSITASKLQNTANLEGNVEVIQGELKINSKTMKIITIINDITKIASKKVYAYENVHVNKKASIEPNDYIDAWSNEMEYDFDIGLLILNGNAKLQRGAECKLDGDIIEYSITKGTVTGKNIKGNCLPNMIGVK